MKTATTANNSLCSYSLLHYYLILITSEFESPSYKKLCCHRYISVKILSTVETSPTTNPWKIEVMELKGYSWLTCSKQPWLIDCCITIIHKLDHWRQEFCWQHDQLAMAKFSKSGVLDKVPEKSAVILGDTHISLQHRVSGIGGKKPPYQKPVWFVRSFLYNTGLW